MSLQERASSRRKGTLLSLAIATVFVTVQLPLATAYNEEVPIVPNPPLVGPEKEGIMWSERTWASHVVWDLADTETLTVYVGAPGMGLIDLEVLNLPHGLGGVEENDTLYLNGTMEDGPLDGIGLGGPKAATSGYSDWTKAYVPSAVFWNTPAKRADLELFHTSGVLGHLHFVTSPTCIPDCPVSAHPPAKPLEYATVTPAKPTKSAQKDGLVFLQGAITDTNDAVVKTGSCFGRETQISATVSGGGPSGPSASGGGAYAHSKEHCDFVTAKDGVGAKMSQPFVFQRDTYADGSQKTFAVKSKGGIVVQDWSDKLVCKGGGSYCAEKITIETTTGAPFERYLEEKQSGTAKLSWGWKVAGWGASGSISMTATEKSSVQIKITKPSNVASRTYYIFTLAGKSETDHGLVVAVQTATYN